MSSIAMRARRTFFEHLCTLLLSLPFDGWNELMAFLLDKLRSKAPNTGRKIQIENCCWNEMDFLRLQARG